MILIWISGRTKRLVNEPRAKTIRSQGVQPRRRGVTVVTAPQGDASICEEANPTGDRRSTTVAAKGAPLPDSPGKSEQYDAVVIGSGFGGAVSAFRLSEAGLSVL